MYCLLNNCISPIYTNWRPVALTNGLLINNYRLHKWICFLKINQFSFSFFISLGLETGTSATASQFSTTWAMPQGYKLVNTCYNQKHPQVHMNESMNQWTVWEDKHHAQCYTTFLVNKQIMPYRGTWKAF